MNKLKQILTRSMQFSMALMVMAIAAQSYGLIDIPFVNELFSFLGGSGVVLGAATASATVEGETPTTKSASDASADLNQNKVSQIITRMRPSANPLDTIMRKVNRSVTSKSWGYEYYTSDVRGVEDTIKTNSAESTTDTHDIYVNNIHIWSKYDLGRVNDHNGYNSRPVVFYVVAKDTSADKLVVVTNNGTTTSEEGDTMPALTSGDNLTRLGNAKDELAAQHPPYNTFPTKATNYAQRFMAQIEQSIFQELHKKEVKWGYNDYRLQALFDLRRSMELSTLFGEKGYIYNPIEENYVYMTGGLTTFIDKEIEYTTDSISNADFSSWAKEIFQGNAGSDQRILFAGDDLMVQLASVGTIEKQLDAGKTKVVYGIRFNQIETNFGELLIRNHELMRNVNTSDANGGWSNRGIVLDIPNIDRFVYKPMQSQTLNLKESGQRNVKAEMIDETFGLALRYPETHAIIKSKSA